MADDTPPALPAPLPAPTPQDLDLQLQVRSAILALRAYPEAWGDEAVRIPLLLARTAADRLSRAGKLRSDGRRGHVRGDHGCSPE